MSTPPTPPLTPYGPRIRRAIAWQKHHTAAFDPAGFPTEPIRYIGGADLAFAPGDGARGLSSGPLFETSGDAPSVPSPPPTPIKRSGAVGSPAIAIAIVWDLMEQRVVEQTYARVRVNFPYVPGLLSFRESPILIAAIKRLRTPVSVWMFDGHGRAHPRGLGLATHMGIQHNLVSIGVAKSLLVGHVDPTASSLRPDGCAQAPVLWQNRTIALALWRPASSADLTLPKHLIYLSPGQHCTLPQATDLVARCLRPGMILPEPTRIADALTKEIRTLPAREGRTVIEMGNLHLRNKKS